MSNLTFTMLKPDAINNGYMGAILDKIVQSGFKIKAMKYTRLTPETAGQFYDVHKARPFYNDLVKYLRSHGILSPTCNRSHQRLFHMPGPCYPKRRYLAQTMFSIIRQQRQLCVS